MNRDRGFSGENPQGPRGGGRGEVPSWKRRPHSAAARVAKDEQGLLLMDQELRAVADLKNEKARERTGQYLVEGVKAVETLIDNARENVVAVYQTEGTEWNKALLTRVPGKLPLRVVSSREMEQISSTKTQQGLVAVAMARALRINWESARRITLVDAVQDPGNLGALFRTSAAFGFDAIVLGKGSVDPFNPRAARGSAGLVASIPFENNVRLEQTIEFLRNKGFTIVGTSPHGKDSIENVALKKKVAILVGNEGKGSSTNLLDQCDAKVRIQMAGGVESLNVAVAHGILAAGLFQRME
ncbi:MAG: RNA methyltransferase [Fibrobacterota bacterium]|nr:RNA methyltransferase [Fibrobacterota bacterium]QQS06899.1 MAG: RNA methyltransferase [Fibrobacterota bacterium]